jgi:predicted amidohydrolase YtcJ
MLGALATPLAASSVRAQGTVKARGPNDADFVFRNGPVFTASNDRLWAKAVAVRDNAIIHVGDEAGLDGRIGPLTRTIDLAGKLLLPGFIEGQIHPVVGSVLTQGINVQYATREETLHALAAWRDSLGKVDAVRGFGWRYSAFDQNGPNKADLDALWPDTPVVLLSSDMHAGWVNSAALARAGLDQNTPDPAPGYSFFARDKTGDLTGFVIELPAMMQVIERATPITVALVASALEEWMPKAAAEGITALFDGGILLIPEGDGHDLYDAMEKAKRLPCRIVGCHNFYKPEEDPLPFLRRQRDRSRTELIRAGVLKMILDGRETQYTAAMLTPYSDRPAFSGKLLLNPGLARDVMLRADAEGFDVVFHAAGDYAVQVALDTVAAAIKANGKRDRHHVIANLTIVSDEDIKRFADLGVIAQFAAQCAAPDVFWQRVTQPRWGAERAARTYPIASLLRAGVIVTFGTDWPEMGHRITYRPLDAIEVAVTRREIGNTDQEPLPPAGEAIKLEEAVMASTISAARQLRLDSKVGSIETGKRADLVVLDRNIFDGPASQIHDAKVQMTLMNGVVRYERTLGLSLPALPVKK